MPSLLCGARLWHNPALSKQRWGLLNQRTPSGLGAWGGKLFFTTLQFFSTQLAPQAPQAFLILQSTFPSVKPPPKAVAFAALTVRSFSSIMSCRSSTALLRHRLHLCVNVRQVGVAFHKRLLTKTQWSHSWPIIKFFLWLASEPAGPEFDAT